jgi:uncharacterized membrane protein
MIVVFKTLAYDTFFLHKLDINHLLDSTRLFSFLFTIICLYLIYKIFEKNKDYLSNEDIIIAKIYSWIASIFLILIIFIELAKDYSFLVTILLALISLIYLFISKISKKNIFYQSMIISLLLFLKVLFYDSIHLVAFDLNSFLSSTRLFSFVLAIVTFYTANYYLEKRKDLLEEADKGLLNVFSYTATLLTFVLIFIEMQEFWISVGWTILALIILLLGFSYRKKYLRQQGIIIFIITILKVFLYDTRGLDTIYRTVSYMVLGIILLLVSFIYTKHKERLKEII